MSRGRRNPQHRTAVFRDRQPPCHAGISPPTRSLPAEANPSAISGGRSLPTLHIRRRIALYTASSVPGLAVSRSRSILGKCPGPDGPRWLGFRLDRDWRQTMASRGSSGGRGGGGGGRSGSGGRSSGSGGRGAGSSAAGPNRRSVTPTGDGRRWAVQKPGADRVSSLHSTQGEAIDRARQILIGDGGGELTVHGRDGRIRDSDTVAPGNDPSPPKDKK